ncbi:MULTISPECIES: type II toxin-antitoxin system MqsA family antitoxin [Comamonas]|uniref:Type II toxin-antitoxin system MqsA family antitoxin n=1 Tax=Comamonas flocculans TaxID=2597701 RepID=A0A5B8RQ72_9BURK|nr:MULTISPECIES: type II toxin-antitoxin system MqsA family antitoxin [Comamonas]QEA11811.1 type II toxin-antitoxin system MqsA family antitoxin [Comamonas flocculans]QXL84895.1 type II toxin-antitoxin system MqsA family antitoxin [Comamonas sp. NLF-1-9]
MTPDAKNRYCLQCDDGTALVHTTKDVHGEIMGVPYSVKGVTGWHCPACGEIEYDLQGDSAARMSAAVEAAGQEARQRQALALRAARKKLGLSQAEAGRLFGGGVSAFSEYERGKTQPHKSTVLLMRLLDKHPNLLAEVR